MATQSSNPQTESDPITPEWCVRQLLIAIGEKPDREGLIDTPKRVVKALREMTSGMNADVKSIMATTFTEECDEMVVVEGISFTSLCEHHLLPFRGVATVGYIPDGKVIGLSKIPRIVDAFAQRLQLQERLTQQIADAIDQCLDPVGVGVMIRAEHMCMACRGVRKSNASMVTSALLGLMKSDPMARAEFVELARGR